MSTEITFTITGRPGPEAIAAAASRARTPDWKPEGRFTLSVKAYRAGPPDKALGAIVSTALAGVLIARGAKVTIWTATHDPDATGERLVVKVERLERPAGGHGAPSLPLPGIGSTLCPSAAAKPHGGAFPADGPGADWSTDPYGQREEPPRPGRGLRGGSAAVQRPRTIAEQIARSKI